MEQANDRSALAARVRIRRAQKAWKFLRDVNNTSLCDLNRVALEDGAPLPADGQIAREIAAFRDFYGPTLRPAMFLSYEREAYYPVDGEDFRLTLDENILWRTDHVDLGTSCFGTSLLGADQVLMELKTPGGIPLWMARFLSEHRIYQTSFSKYGTAYQQWLAEEKYTGGIMYA